MITEEEIDKIVDIYIDETYIQSEQISHITLKTILIRELLGMRIEVERKIVTSNIDAIMSEINDFIPDSTIATRQSKDSPLEMISYREFVRRILLRYIVEKPEITREEIEKWCKGLKPINTIEDIHRIRSSIVVFCEDH